MKAWRKACPQSLHRKGVCTAWPPCCRWRAEPGVQALLHSGLPQGASSLRAAWGWRKPKAAGKARPDIPLREGFSGRRTRQLSPSSRGASSSCSLHRQPGTEEAGAESGPAGRRHLQHWCLWDTPTEVSQTCRRLQGKVQMRRGWPRGTGLCLTPEQGNCNRDEETDGSTAGRGSWSSSPALQRASAGPVMLTAASSVERMSAPGKRWLTEQQVLTDY